MKSIVSVFSFVYGLWLLIFVLLTGCAAAQRPLTDVAMIDWAPRIAHELAATVRANTLAVDENYLSITDAQITQLLAFVKKHQRRGRYHQDLWDCDDIAREFRVLASEWAVQTFKPPAPGGLACTTLLVNIHEGRIDGLHDYQVSLHAMTAVRRNDGVWFLIEPASCKRTPLLGPIYEGSISVIAADL